MREPDLGPESAMVILMVDRVMIRRKVCSVQGGLQVRVRGASKFRERLGALHAGDRIRLWAALSRPRGFMNPGGFDVAAYLGRNGMSLYGSVKSALLVERVEQAPWWKSLGSRVRGLVRRRIHGALGPLAGPKDESAGVLLALLIGDRSFIPPWAGKLYQQAGTFHVIAISGAHVGLFAWFVYGGLRRLGVDQRPALLLLLAILPLYASLCGGRPSVVRAVLMCSCVAGTKLLSLDAPGVNGLALSALLLLAFRPLDLHDPGFQLSFVATASIFAFAGPISRQLRPLLGRLSSLIAISVAAQAGVVPILAWHFQRLTPAAIGANLLAMPLAAGIIVTGAFVVVVAPLPWLGEGAARVAWLLVKALTLTSQAAVALPGGSLRVVSPSILWMVAYLVALSVAAVSPGRWRRGMVVAMCLLTLWLSVYPLSPIPRTNLRFTALDVGHGDALLLELPGGENLLVDGGGSYSQSFDVGESVVVPALLYRGVKVLDAVILTHPDVDHLGGLQAVVSNLKVKEVWEGRPAWEQKGYRDLRAQARARGTQFRRLSAGEEIHLGEVCLRVLSVGSGGRPETSINDESLMIRVSYGHAAVLLTGDAEEAAEAELLRSGEVLRADVLKIGHHGSRSSTAPDFLEAVSPRIAVISCGSSGLFNLPSTEVLQLLAAHRVTCLRTDRDGAVSLNLDRWGGIEVETFRQSR